MNLEIRNEIVKLCVIEFAFLNHNTSFKEPGGSEDKETACNVGETWVQSLGWDNPLEQKMATHSSILA